MSEVAETKVAGQVAPLQLPARTIPAPGSISPAAQAALARLPLGPVAYPPIDDIEAWRKVVALSDQGLLSMMVERAKDVVADVETRVVDDVIVFVITPANLSAEAEGRVYLDIHGGALIMGWSVDYRMPPDHPYPTPLDDCVVAYRALLRDYRPDDIIVGGASAGGNLAAALILRARDEGLPLPAAAVLLTPEVDLTESGDSFQTNLGIDTVLTRSLAAPSKLYAAGHALEHPYLSPLFGDFTKGFPPTFLQTGTRDLFLSNTVRMHRALREAGVPAELHVFEAMPHGGFGVTSEDAELDAEVRRFVDAHW
ncbi:MAG: alpha/beta hydrolase [Actinobacteria bacterium]|nr:MAG: alpha/beta hydrolase [Actinomycetota bacterium]